MAEKVPEKETVKKTWKQQQKVTPRVKEQLSKNAVLPSRKATRLSKQAFKKAKRDYKLKKSTYKVAQQKYRRQKQAQTTKKTINQVIAKKHYLEAKTEKKVTKKVYKKTKAADGTRVTVQLKREAKQGAKNKVLYKAEDVLREDDTLKEIADASAKYRRGKQNLRIGGKAAKGIGKVSLKAGKGTYGITNRSYNYLRGNGFQRTPEEFTARRKAMVKIRNVRQRRKVAKEAKKAEKGVRLLQSVFNGQKSIKQAAILILKSPITWVVIGLFCFFAFIAGTVSTTPKPAIVQDEFDLTDSWTYFTKEDAEHTDTSNVFYTPIDDVMFYMNGVYEDYRLNDVMWSGMTRYQTYLSELWEALNGKGPDYEVTTMDQLMTDKKSKYYLAPKIYEELNETRQTFGYSTLDGQLGDLFDTDSYLVTRRYGYERNGENIDLKHGIDLSVTNRQEIAAPMAGKVSVDAEKNSVTITSEKEALVTLTGLSTGRFRGGETVTEGEYLGNTTKESLHLYYEKFNEEKSKWQEVNPAFYLKKVTYTQFTSVASDSFDPKGDVAKRAKVMYDALMKEGGTREGISAVLGCFAIESAINPKRAEGDYLAPPIGASAHSWDDPTWLSMGGMDIYGKFPNILHRGLGLGQWTDTSDGGNRHTLLLNFAKAKNKKWYDLNLQIDFMLHGDTPGNRTAFMNTITSKAGGTIPELTNYFLTYWEGNPGDKLSERIQEAQNWYNYFSSNAGDMNSSSKEVFEKYKDKMKPLPTNKEMKDGWPGNSYALGNCTWYVYNRMHQLGKSINPVMGNANQWVYNYIMTPGASLVSTPKRGDIIIFTNGAGNSSPIYGHVAVVEYVNGDGSFVISEMNIQGIYTMGWRVLQKQPGEYFMRVK